jgi:hypothetical protein
VSHEKPTPEQIAAVERVRRFNAGAFVTDIYADEPEFDCREGLLKQSAYGNRRLDEDRAILADAYLSHLDATHDDGAAVDAFTCYHIFRHYGTPLAAMESSYSGAKRETAIRDFTALRMDDDESFGEAWARLGREGWSCQKCSVKPITINEGAE